jgi:hypothetical protein
LRIILKAVNIRAIWIGYPLEHGNVHMCAVWGTADVKELEKEGHHIVVQSKEGVGATAGGQTIQRRARTQTRQLILTVGHREIGSKNGVVSVYVRCIERVESYTYL